jgi:ubiquitin C-terminal hydrolase
MSLTKYDESLAIHHIGFRNLGATCYFNALLQSMLSCTSFIDEIISHKNDVEYTNNTITKLIIEFVELLKYYEDLCKNNNTKKSKDPEIISNISDTQTKLNNYSPQIWKHMILILCKKKNIPVSQFMQGQQCAGEGFHYLLEAIEEFQNIQNLFLHRYKSLIRCFDCDKWVSNVDCMYNLFEVEPDLKLAQSEEFDQYNIETKNMNEFLTKQSSYVDKDYICPECKKRGEKYRMNALVMVPEVLVVMSKKYTLEQKLDVYTHFPKELMFTGCDANPILYEAVSQIEHYGGRHGGHYVAICRRKTGWFEFNDRMVVPSKFEPTKHTYIVFYHLT